MRELCNLVKRLLLTSRYVLVTIDDLPRELTGGGIVRPPEAPRSSLHDVERDAITRATDHECGNVAGAARLLGVSRSTIGRKICRYGLAADQQQTI